MTYTIEVTAEDIRHGKRSSCRECPVAMAVARVFPRLKVEAFQGAIYVGLYSAPTTKQVNDFISLFDLGYAVAPFSFQLEIL